MLHRFLSTSRVVAAAVVSLLVSVSPVLAQSTLEPTAFVLTPSPATVFALATPAVDSAAKKCMDVRFLAPEAVCYGRLQNSLALAMMGAAFVGLNGAVGGWAIKTSCIGNYERAATRGAIAGAGTGLLVGLLVPYISQREQAERLAREKAAPQTPAPKAWSWDDVKPFVLVGGTVAATGAAIGAVQGAVKPSDCGGGVAGGAATGAAVYGSGFVIGVTGLLLGVRLLF